MNDLINRQDAIDAIRTAYFDKDIQSAKDDPCIVDAMTDWAIRQIKSVPTTLDDIVRVLHDGTLVFTTANYEWFNRVILEDAKMNQKEFYPNDWIPCSERLPKKGEKVLASTKNTVFTQVFKGTHGASDSWRWNNNTIKTICAWMPLPQPWKEVEDE